MILSKNVWIVEGSVETKTSLSNMYWINKGRTGEKKEREMVVETANAKFVLYDLMYVNILFRIARSTVLPVMFVLLLIKIIHNLVLPPPLYRYTRYSKCPSHGVISSSVTQ